MKIRQGNDKAAGDGDLARRLGIAIRAAHLGIWEWDLRTNEFDYSDRAKEIFGFDKNEPVTRERIIEVLHPDDHQVAKEQAARSLDPSLEKRDPYRYRIYRADTGEMHWIHAFGEPVFETINGELVAVRFIGTLQDVTEEVLAKERIAHQEARLRLAIDASGVAVWELNLSDQTVTHSPELNRLCGFPPDAHPTLEEFRSRYAPGERERIEKLGAEARARGDTKLEAEIRHIWPDGTQKWLALRAQLAPGETEYGGRVIGVLVDITEQKKREEHQSLLLSELKHRIKNSFAITQSIISQTLRGEDLAEQTRSKLIARLQAMADAHDLVSKGAWESASLKSIMDRAREAFEDVQNSRIDLRSDEVALSPRAALSFSLVLHELFTNAVKYGSLSNSTGRVRIHVMREEIEDEPIVKFEWVETGGPPVAEGTREGFGTRLLERVFAVEFDAKIRRKFNAEGFRCEIQIPIRRLTD